MRDAVIAGGAEPRVMAAYGEQDKLSWLLLLKGQIERYTQGDSSSVPLETAGGLLRSLVYTAGLARDEYPGQECSAEALYQKGRERLDRLVKKARRLLYLVQSTMLPVDAPCYREAIEKGIPVFFRDYDPDFAAHETPGDFDYPASIPCAASGVTWILHFLDTLYWENVFCRRFAIKEAEGVLRAQGLWGVAVPVNIFEPIMEAALFGFLVNRGPASSLAVHGGDVKRLVRLLSPLPPRDIATLVREACGKMMEAMKIQSAPCRALLLHQADALSARLAPAVLRGDASMVFPPWESPPPPVAVMDGDPMADEDFRTLAGELAACRYFSDKLMLVRRRVNSLYDLTGLMESGCFNAREMARLFSVLAVQELAALMRMGRGAMLMNGRWIFPEFSALPEDAPRWEKCLYGYLKGVEPTRRNEIATIAVQLQTVT